MPSSTKCKHSARTIMLFSQTGLHRFQHGSILRLKQAHVTTSPTNTHPLPLALPGSTDALTKSAAQATPSHKALEQAHTHSIASTTSDISDDITNATGFNANGPQDAESTPTTAPPR